VLGGCADSQSAERTSTNGSTPPARTTTAPSARHHHRAHSNRRTHSHRHAHPQRAHPRSAFPSPTNAHPAVVTHVTDGDTITLDAIGKTRLIGIDTPEVYGQTECFGRAASAFTKRVLAPGTHVEYQIGVEAHDKYGRSLAYVWLPDGRMFNGMLAEEGYATVLTIPPNVDYADYFVAAARRARDHNRGLWSPRTCNGVNPVNSYAKGDKDCSDFKTHAEAQAYFDSHGGSAMNNFDNLDGSDHDGQVCETLP
jgi:micrococcal nuclease